jgi:flagellar basal body-associated protein FliL
MSIYREQERTVLDNFEEKYVGFYRWLLLIIGILSLLGIVALIVSLVWSTSKTSLPDSSNYFGLPEWTELRREILPLRMKLEESRPVERKPRKELPVDKRVQEIKINLLANFAEDQIEEAGNYFSVRLLNEWLLIEIPVSRNWRDRLINDLVKVSKQIGVDERIARISSIEGRSRVIMDSVETFVTSYLKNIDIAEDAARRKQSDEADRKALITTQILIAIPIAIGIFLSMIGLILLIRMELHLRKLSSDYRKANLQG